MHSQPPDLLSAANSVPGAVPGVEPRARPTARRHGTRRLTETDAVEIWIARWLRLPRIELLRRYDCDPRRIYEVWSGERFPAAKDRAWALFVARYPELVDRVDTGNHRTLHRAAGEGQLPLFK